ncbi:MAG TPA: paraquat-inducible protein A [Kofleriaceae bacterium]
MMTATQLGVVSCPLCELVMRSPGSDADCPRCGQFLPRVSRRGIAKCWALVIAAVALYFPANVLPMMHTEQFPMHRDDTILSGIKFLWSEGSWELAVLVFAASILVPLTKLIVLGFLLVTSSRRSTWRPRVRTRMYRALEVIGHWSMLDVFVVSLLTAVVQLGRFASVEPGPAVLPFASVVVLTMLASASFDPRTIWVTKS